MPLGSPEQPIVEQPRTLARITEQLEQRPAAPERASASPAARASIPQSSAAPRVQKSPLREDIEIALADEQLKALYMGLDPQVQQAFRGAASRLAERLEAMFVRGPVDVREAHGDIVRWLHVIPRLNRWFLTQEAKVKTDAILALARKQK
ncbi:MAG: hypothetical protein Q7T01_01350 [bacterium]|nr:hypothetical protein [bacterium]